jgi:hypothetical protein
MMAEKTASRPEMSLALKDAFFPDENDSDDNQAKRRGRADAGDIKGELVSHARLRDQADRKARA